MPLTEPSLLSKATLSYFLPRYRGKLDHPPTVEEGNLWNIIEAEDVGRRPVL
jgi:hypothetical protein